MVHPIDSWLLDFFRQTQRRQGTHRTFLECKGKVLGYITLSQLFQNALSLPTKGTRTVLVRD